MAKYLGYNKKGFNEEGVHKNGTKYDDNGYDFEGFDSPSDTETWTANSDKLQNGIIVCTPAEDDGYWRYSWSKRKDYEN